MKFQSVSHDRSKESPEEKARWFQRLSLEERMELLCFYTDLILRNNPDINKEKMLNRLKNVFKSFQKNDS